MGDELIRHETTEAFEMSASSDFTLLERLASLIGDQTVVLHAPDMEEGDEGLSGGDIDCVVHGLDPMWPLRLTGGWQLCQAIRYDLRGWYWVLERNGEMLAFDTIDDPWGLGRDAIRTDSFLAATAGAPRSTVRAIYLTIKRIRKHDLSGEEWARIGKLAGEDPEAFEGILSAVAGSGMFDLLAPSALAGVAPDEEVVRKANDRRYLRRFGSPDRAVRAFLLGAQRYVERIGDPNGLTVLVGGPDGSGKSTLVQEMPALLGRTMKRARITHWRPGCLPQLGWLVGSSPGDPTQPHARPPRGRFLSLAVLAYDWLDFALGHWLFDQSATIRTGLVVRERGWWDLAVDPLRYRLTVSPNVVNAVGSLLKQPDAAVILEAPPEFLLERKAEIDRDELVRQTAAWREALPKGVPQLFVDASRPADEVARDVRSRLLSLLEARTVARLGAGWVTLPGRGPRWWIPRGPRSMTITGLSIYQPVTARGLLGWRAAKALATAGGFRALPRGSAPPRAVRAAIAEFIPPGGSLAVARSNHRGRFVAMILDRRGHGIALAKVATDDAGAASLAAEAASLEGLGPLLPMPLHAPAILDRRDRALILEHVEHWPRDRSWRLDADVAAGLGKFFRRGAEVGADGLATGLSHGDFAPWNLLKTGDGWALIDWESATSKGEPFADLCHFVVQGHTLLGSPSEEVLLRGFLERDSWVGTSIDAYADAAGLDPAAAPAALRSYLSATRRRVEARTPEERRGIARRDRLARLLSDR